MLNDESVVLLDPNGREIGTCGKAQVHAKETPLHLAFSCYVFHEESLLITQRSYSKKTFPGVWTNSVCGHPSPGEGLVSAVERRAYIELGIQLEYITLALPQFSYRASFQDIEENEKCPVFVARLAGDLIKPDPSEVAGWKWVNWATFVREVISHRRDVSPWCYQQVAQLSKLRLQSLNADARLLPPAASL